jgi:hypothetical protein
LAEAVNRYPLPAKKGEAPQWTWSGPAAKTGDQPPSDQEAKDFWKRFRSVWTERLQATGHLNVFEGLEAAFRQGQFLALHGGLPSTQGGMRALLESLDGSTPLDPEVLTEIIWNRARTKPGFLHEMARLAELPGAPTHVAAGHTPSLGIGLGSVFDPERMQQVPTSAFFIDAGFGLNTLILMHITDDGRVALVAAKRSAQGIKFVPLPIEGLAGLGNTDLPNR